MHLASTIIKLCSRLEQQFAKLQGKGYEVTLTQEIGHTLSTLRSVPTLAVDVGGNIGDYTYELRRACPGVEVHVFEPSSANIERLQIRFGKDENVKIVPAAVSDRDGVATLFSNAPGSGLASLTKRKLDHFHIDFNSTEQVNMVRFEEYWKQQLNGRKIDILKIDVEGHELSVLNSLGSAIDATKVIQFEFGGTCIDTRIFFRDFWYFFLERSFSLFRMTPFGLQVIERYSERDECFSYSNFVAVNGNQ